MRFRLTLLLGMAVGYVLGTKAGRERYEQLMDMWRQFKGSETGQQMTEQVSHLAEQAKEAFQAKTSEGVSKASEALSSAQSSGSGMTSSGTTGSDTTATP